MNYKLEAVMAVGMAVVIAGCDGVLDIILPSTVTVTLVNESPDFDVDAVFYYDDEDDLPEFLLVETGTQREVTVGPAQQVSFTRSCDDLRSLILDDADLQIIGGLGPETSSDVLRIDDEYECGDEIIFTFTHSDLLLDFDVSWTVIPGMGLVLKAAD